MHTLGIKKFQTVTSHSPTHCCILICKDTPATKVELFSTQQQLSLGGECLSPSPLIHVKNWTSPLPWAGLCFPLQTVAQQPGDDLQGDSGKQKLPSD